MNGVYLQPWIKTHGILLCILFIATGLRLYKITSPLYDWNAWRQTETAAIAMNYYQDNVPFLYPEIDWVGEGGHAEMEFPIFPYLISWLYFFTVPWDGWGRVMSLLASLGVVIAVWDIGRQWRNETLGLFAAAFFAVSPLSIYYGRAFMPDMAMVFFAALSVAMFLRWMNSLQIKWMYLSAIALSIGVLMKPPCLMVSFPLLWILFYRSGWRFIKNKHVWIALAVIFLPAVMWYAHAGMFYAESKASFMRHFKDVTVFEYLAINWQWRNWETILVERISENIFAYVGWLPFSLGFIRLCFFQPKRWFLLSWLLATFIFYAVIAAHHRGHDYYSLLPIVPLSLVCAYGCEWIYKALPNPFRYAVWLVPFLMGVVGFIGLLRFDAYRQWYHYYQDAKAMQSRIPKDSLILVMDEILHTPEFFYFTGRNGWHRHRDPQEGVVDDEWVERHRAQGADYYFGLNEAPGNHPLLYLQNHPMGQYIYTNYEIGYIGPRFFVANLNKPLSDAQRQDYLDTKVITPPAVIQAEQLLTENAELVEDEAAVRGSALLAQSKGGAQLIAYGPYFHFPNGVYDFTFRLESPQPQEKGSVQIAIQSGDEFLASKRLYVGEDITNEYKDFTLTQTVNMDMPVETRVTLEPLTSVLFDTVSIRHRKHIDQGKTEPQYFIDLVVVQDEIMKLSNQGELLQLDGELYEQFEIDPNHVKGVYWDEQNGLVTIRSKNNGMKTTIIPADAPQKKEGEAIVATHRNGRFVAELTNKQRVLSGSDDSGVQYYDLPQTTTPPQDVAVTADGEVFVLYGSGKLLQLGEVDSQYNLPDFGADVCRCLIPVDGGFYVVDALGAIHNTEGIPPVRSPYYKAEDWIKDAERTSDGTWAFLTNDGKVLTFEE